MKPIADIIKDQYPEIFVSMKMAYHNRIVQDGIYINEALNYFSSWKTYLNLDCVFYVDNLPCNVLGKYDSLNDDYGKKSGKIVVDVSKVYCMDALFHTIRHELTHAICDLRFNNNFGHGKLWIRIARLMNVDVGNYVDGGKYCCNNPPKQLKIDHSRLYLESK